MIRLLVTNLFLILACCNTVSAEPTTLLILGDSLSAGYQMKQDQSWPHLLRLKLDQCDSKTTVINLSENGDTTQNGLQKLPNALKKYKPDIVVIELGGNDGLRGYSLSAIESNLNQLIVQAKAAKAQVALLGIRLPPNYGPDYTKAFDTLYSTLAKKHDIRLVPFFIEKAVLNPELMFRDGIHPKASAQPILLEAVTPTLLDMKPLSSSCSAIK